MKLRKIIEADNIYKEEELGTFKVNFKECLSDVEKMANKYIDLFTHCEYHYGTYEDAVKCSSNLLFQIEEKKKSKRVFSIISKNCGVRNFEKKRTDYYRLVERIPSGMNFFLFSDTPYLSNLNKIAYFNSGKSKSFGKYLYSNSDVDVISASVDRFNDINSDYPFQLPPDDLDIRDYSLVKIRRLKSGFSYLQKRFVKKVNSFQNPRIAYIVMYGEYLIGGFGFLKSPSKDYDLEQICDFSTNNRIYHLSKFILMCLLTKDVKTSLGKFWSNEVCSVFTYAYTKYPVSMKYRGLYSKVDDKCSENLLFYTGELGKFSGIIEIVQLYQKSKENGK